MHKAGQTRRSAIGRAIVLTIVVGVLVIVSMVSDPELSSATSIAPREAAPWLDEDGRWPLVGELISPSHVVRVYAADGGTVYTVCRPDGRVIRSGLSGIEVAEMFPGLDLSPIGDGGYVLMQVETDG